MVPNSVEQLLGEILGGRRESGGHLYVYGIWSSLRLDFCCGLHSMTKVLCKLSILSGNTVSVACLYAKN